MDPTQLLLQALNAFESGNRRAGAALIDQILRQDFTHRGAWELLHQELGKGQGFDEFRRAFAQKYYPNHAYQLGLDPLPNARAEPDFPEPDMNLRRVTIPRSKFFEQQPRLPHPDTAPLPQPYRMETPPEAAAEPPPPGVRAPQADSSPRERRPPRTPRPRPERAKPPGLFTRLFDRFKSAAPAKPQPAKPSLPPQAPPAQPVPAVPPSPAPAGAPSLARLVEKSKPRPPLPAPPAPQPPPVHLQLLEDDDLRRGEIKVLIVDDIPQTRENIRKLLQLEPKVSVVGAAGTGQQGVDLALQHEPDVVLMDINMPDMDGLQATKLIHSHLPLTQVIMLTVQDDPNYMREALRSGARNFLIKPPSINDLFAAVSQAYAFARAERQRRAPAAAPAPPGAPALTGAAGKVIAIYSPKGGTGRSTLAVNLAVALQTDDTPVLLVDGNFQFGDLALLFNEQGRNSIADLTPRVQDLDPSVVGEVVIRHKASGVSILAAPARPEAAEGIRPVQFLALLNYLRGLYAYIIVDAPGGLTETVFAIFDAADLTLLLASQDIPTLSAARKFLDLAPSIGIESSQQLFLVLNQYNPNVNLTPERIGDSFKRPINAVIPYEYRTTIPALNRGIPFMLDPAAKAQPIGRAVLELAAKVRSVVSELA
jgi:pilus assembly protein CpaE